MMPQPNLAQPQVSQQTLSAVDLAQPFGRHFGSIGKTRRQAGRGGKVPAGQTRLLGKRTNLLLGKARRQQRRENSVFFGGPVPRTEIPLVVGIDPIGERIESKFVEQVIHPRKKFALAVIATVGRIASVLNALHFMG